LDKNEKTKKLDIMKLVGGTDKKTKKVVKDLDSIALVIK